MNKAKKISDKNSTSNPFEDREGLVYARVSSRRQETEGSGLGSQEGRCIKELAVMKVPYVKTFPDSFSGGGDFMNRPAMRELLEYIDAHPHKKFVVIFDDLSRFARDVFFHIKLRAEFKKRDVILKCLNYNFDDSEEGEFAELIFAGKAELDRKQNRRQVIQKQKARLELGYWAFGSKKGYTMTRNSEHGTLSVPNKDGEILKEALEGFATGRFIRKMDVCKFLVEEGFWKKQSPEKYIDKVTQIIKDPFYAGFIEYPVWEVSRRPGKHQGIISAETFELNQQRLGKLDFGKRIRVDTSDDFPLRGLLVCASCGGHLTGVWANGRNKKHPYYFCQNKMCVEKGKTSKKDVIEAEFDNLLKEIVLKKDISGVAQLMFDRAWSQEVYRERKTQNDFKFQKIELENKIEQYANLMLATTSDTLKRTYEHRIERFAEEIKVIDSNMPQNLDLDIPYRTALGKVTGLLKSPYSVWVDLDTKEQQSLFYFIFDKKLSYSVKEGYRTAPIPSVIRLFEEFSTSDTLDVEMTGIEPVCRRLLQRSLHV